MLIALTLRIKRLTVLKDMVTTGAAGPWNINAPKYNLENWPGMKTSSHGNIFCVTAHLCGEFTGPPKVHQRSKRFWGWWFQTLLRPLWRHCNEILKISRLRTARRCDQIVNIILVLTEAFGLKDTYRNQINVTLKFKISNGQYISNASLNFKWHEVTPQTYSIWLSKTIMTYFSVADMHHVALIMLGQLYVLSICNSFEPHQSRCHLLSLLQAFSRPIIYLRMLVANHVAISKGTFSWHTLMSNSIFALTKWCLRAAKY